MIAVKVQYTVRAGYIEQNKQNIKMVMEELKSNPIEGMDYKAFNVEGTGIFIHINVSENEEVLKKINTIEVFRFFQSRLKASEPVSSPKVEYLDIL